MEAGNAPLISASQPSLETDVTFRTIRKLDRRFLSLLVGVAFLDYAIRGNVGYAARDLCRELNLSHEEYGRGVSLFFVGYLLTQIIGNILLKRLGAPIWISLLVFSWGCVATAMGFLQTATHFYLLRILLGLVDGGTFPAVWYIITVFYPPDHVTAAYSVISSGACFSIPVSSTISAGLLSLGPYVGVEGWRLLFIAEGMVPVLYSLFLYALFPVSPEMASFLDADEKQWIAFEHDNEDGSSGLSFWEEVKTVVSNSACRVCTVCALLDFGISNIIMFWTTLIIHDMLYGDDEEGDSETCGSKTGNAVFAIMLTAIPFSIAGILCLLSRYYIFRNRSRITAILYCVAGGMLIMWVAVPRSLFVLRFLLLTCTIVAKCVAFIFIAGLMMTSCQASVRSTAASLFNTIATVGPIVLPLVFGKLMDVIGSDVAVAMCGGICLILALLILQVKDPLLRVMVQGIDSDDGLAEEF